jgi:four helix bundle protein
MLFDFSPINYSRSHRKEFIEFLQIAYGSVAELKTQLQVSKEICYLKTKDFEEVPSLLDEVLK